MTTPDDLDARFIAYYDAEAAAGVRSTLSELRVELLESFTRLLDREGRASVLDVGAGPGRDVERFASMGCSPVGLDLAAGNVGVMCAAGHHGIVGSIYALPVASASCAAVWTMSTLVHVPDERLDVALAELVRVAEPGAPIGIGSWGGRDWEGTHEFTRFEPARFFSLRAHDRWREALDAVGLIERFDTFETAEPDWDYQFAVVRVAG